MRQGLVAAVLILVGAAGCAGRGRVPTEERWREAQRAFDESVRLKDEGRYTEAVPIAERALHLREELLGRTHLEVSHCLHLLGEVHWRMGAYARAEPLMRRELAIREQVLGKEHLDVATTLNNLASLFFVQGLQAQAQPLYERALAIREAALGTHHPDVAMSLNNLATLLDDQGLYARAEPLHERALAIRERALGKKHPSVSASLTNLANLYKNQGFYARAEPLYERAIRIWEAASGRDHADLAIALNSLANLYREQGLYARAEPLYERAIAIREAALGQNHPDVAATLNNLAVLYDDRGLYSRAEPLYERVLAIWEQSQIQQHPHVAATLNNLALLYQRQGNASRAQQLHERALVIREAVFGEHHPVVAVSLNNLANLYKEQGLYARAEPLYERALAIREEALGQSHPDVAESLNDLGNLYACQGLYAQAERLYARALALREAALGQSHMLVAASLTSLALLYQRQGLHDRARPLYERALAVGEETLGKHHPQVITTLLHLARFSLSQQRLAEALPFYARAFTASEVFLRRELLGVSEVRLTRYLGLLRGEEEELYALASAHPEEPRVRHLALAAALLRKGRSVEELTHLSHLISRGLGEEDRRTFESLRAVRTQLSTLALSGPGTLSPADHQLRLQQLADEGDALEAGLAKRSAPMRALSSLPSPEEIIPRVVKALPRGSALVEFVAYRDSLLIPMRGALASQAPASLRYLALLLFADGRTHAVDLGPAERIDRAVLRLHQALESRTADASAAAQVLYQRVFRPIAPHLGKVQRLFVSPDGQLALVPFAALHDGRRYLVERMDITYLTSGKEALPRPEELPLANSVVVLADPQFVPALAAPSLDSGGVPALTKRSASVERVLSAQRSEGSDQPWPSLPGTRKEAETIHRLFPEARLLLGPAATKEALLTLKPPGILHVATHGFFLEDSTPSGSTRAVGYFGAAGDAGPQQPLADPLLRSGLVLAGTRAPPGPPRALAREDSLVTALELAGLDLWGTQLVVLSACDTGRGEVRLGQGVYGLRRALMVAGAESLVTSLWKVDDTVTHQLMALYYQHLLAGEGRSAALHQAMRTLRQTQPHPHFWAPFILAGQAGPLRGLEAQAQPSP
ncbi:CHAT domain-containing tetratricopeptide repeat protein [Hyalangium minutum]|uniref:CHAT domain-containing protein n=1 Tax=Hyalangium minutum TaxID=394096 RepID=A0A085W708_9BACT|nr:CHAT domain-containing tetratricopeptide repeat protein [Hyalangium minutum]KFE63471.1 hypothetical protein DB31_2589 [Hyalangium minutum]